MEFLVNIRKTGNKIAEFEEVKILDYELVYTSLDIAIAKGDLDKCSELYVVGEANAFPKILEHKDVLKIEKETDVHYFVEDDFYEDTEYPKAKVVDKYTEGAVSVRLPKETNLEKAIMIDGNVYILE